jgi:hypothetical protein
MVSPASRRTTTALAALTLLGAAPILSGCSSGVRPLQPSATASGTATPSATPVPTAAPDSQAIGVVVSGIGIYQETTVPVALVHNQSLLSYVSGASAHFDVVAPGGRVLVSTDVAVPPLGPDGDGAVAARLAVSGYSNTVRVRVSGGAWSAQGQASTTLQGTVSCEGRACPSGPQSANAAVAGRPPVQGVFTAAAVCFNQAGTVTGGGSTTLSSTVSAISVPLILSSPAVRCSVTFSAAF